MRRGPRARTPTAPSEPVPADAVPRGRASFDGGAWADACAHLAAASRDAPLEPEAGVFRNIRP